MPRPRRVVTSISENLHPNLLPDWASEGAVLAQVLRDQGVWTAMEERLRIYREGGYVGVDIVAFLLFCLTANLKGGIKGFAKQAAPHARRLAALVDRRSLPATASVSRVLTAVGDEHSNELAEWLLIEASGILETLRHPATQTCDAIGQGWHVFDLDQTSTVLRQRALPEGADLPEPSRRSKEMKAGYPGRKRGDVQISRMTLQHAGSTAWMGLWAAPGNGRWREHSEAAIRRVESVVKMCGWQRTLLRVDGAGGNVPLITSCEEAGIHYLTRWSQYEKLSDPIVRCWLNKATWQMVRDSGSGPQRQAADAGWLLLHAADTTVRSNGQPYAPVRSRIVVSRFKCRGDGKRGTGTVIDGWQYEGCRSRTC